MVREHKIAKVPDFGKLIDPEPLRLAFTMAKAKEKH
jgi:NitT/TauT family transport system substrate-binding protein/sulfonate transport system substrate-binding protein